MELVDRRSDANWLRSKYAASERRVCGLMGMAVASYGYRTSRSDEPLRTHLVELAREKPRFGYRRLQVLLGRAGEHVNHKRVHRVYREAGLMIRRKKRKHCLREGKPLLARTSANQEWALDFVHDAVECGRTIRVLSVVDAYTRECLALEVDTSFASRRVTRVLDAIVSKLEGLKKQQKDLQRKSSNCRRRFGIPFDDEFSIFFPAWVVGIRMLRFGAGPERR
jgi:putative transposase